MEEDVDVAPDVEETPVAAIGVVAQDSESSSAGPSRASPSAGPSRASPSPGPSRASPSAAVRHIREATEVNSPGQVIPALGGASPSRENEGNLDDPFYNEVRSQPMVFCSYFLLLPFRVYVTYTYFLIQRFSYFHVFLTSAYLLLSS